MNRISQQNLGRQIAVAVAVLATGLLATTTFAVSKYQQVTENLHPTYYWPLNEPQGATVAAEDPNPIVTGTATLAYAHYNTYPTTFGKQSVPGISESAFALIGATRALLTTAEVDPGNLNTFTPHSFTVEYWVNGTTSSGHGTWGFNTGAAAVSGWGNGTHSFSFQQDAFGTQFFGFNVDSNIRLRMLTAPPDNQWNLVAWTFTETVAGTDGHNDAQGVWRYYINGQLQPFGINDDLNPDHAYTEYLQTGLPDAHDRGPWNSLNAFIDSNGAVDELAIFGSALSQNQILDQLYAIPEPGLLSLLALGGAFMVWRRKVAAKRA